MIIPREIREAGIVASTIHTKNAHVTPVRQPKDKRWSGTPSKQQLVMLKSNTAVGTRDCSLLQNAQTVSGVQTTCYKMGIAVLSRGSSCRGREVDFTSN